MPVDTSIYGNLLRAPKSVLEYGQEMDQADLARGQVAQQKLNLIGAQQAFNDQQAVRSLYQKPGFDPSTTEGMQALSAASPTTALATRKAMLDNQKTQADTTLANANAEDALAKAQKTRVEHAIAVQAQIAQAAGAATDQASWDRGIQIAQALGADVSKVPKVFDPATAKSIQQQALTGAQQLDEHYKQLTAAETARHNVAEEGLTKRGQDVQSANNAANINKDFLVAGLDPKNPSGGLDKNTQSIVDDIGQGRIAPPSGVALRNPRMVAIMGAVAQQYPNFDATTYAAKTKSARDFSTGPQGNAMRSFATSQQHLDQLGGLIDALDNGNNQTINKFSNAVSAWNGGTAPTNFDAAKDVVSKEVIKAIVGGGGGVAERAELSDQLSKAKSPAQLKGVVKQYRDLMAAQHDNLLAQRRAAGLPDSTLPDYSGGGPGALPGADAIAAELARRAKAGQ